jgi:hypothetical protein
VRQRGAPCKKVAQGGVVAVYSSGIVSYGVRPCATSFRKVAQGGVNVARGKGKRILGDVASSTVPVFHPRGHSARARRSLLDNLRKNRSHHPAFTNLLGVPSSGPPVGGRHNTTSSIFFARAKSLSVIPPAEWVLSLTHTLPQVTARSG